MPFRSEKQRRFLWAKHPEIAKEWAHKYPKSNKDLPMYAHENKEGDKPVSKKAALTALKSLVVNNLNQSVKSMFNNSTGADTKKANSKLLHVEMPKADQPFAEGDIQIKSILKPEAETEGSIGQERSLKTPEKCESMQSNPLLSKLAVVLAPRIQQEIENIRAQQEAREANRTPQNVNIKKYPVVNNTIPPPMGMAAAPQAPQQPAQPQAQPNGQLAPVGGGQSPNANPINAFGGLSSTGDINGNAALGTQNMAGGEKMAAQKCSCGCGQKVNECTCPPSCSCRQKGGSCYGLKKQAGGNNAALAKITSIDGAVHADAAELDELEDEMYSAFKFGEKLAVEVIQPFKKHKRQPAFPKQIQDSTVSGHEAEAIARAMAAAAPHGALDNTRVDLYGTRVKDLQERMTNNQRLSPLQRWLYRYDSIDGLPDKTQMLPDAYHSHADTVWLPSGNPGVMMHELGHSIDFNAYPNTTPRMLLAGLYARTAPTLWKEHAAWNKGQKYFLEGAAQNKLPPDLVVKTLRDASRGKRMGLGSYWGAGLGGLAGLAGGAGLMAANPNMDPRVVGLTAALGGAAGGLSGLTLGNYMAEHPHFDSPEASQKYLNKYVRAYAKKHKLDPTAAEEEIQQLARKLLAKKQQKKKPKKPALAKAASSPAWQRSEGKNEEGGLNEKGRKSYERETGGNLKAPVTESNPSGERAKRQNSFCSRMCGMKRVNTGASTAKDPDSRINKSLRKWNCKCSSASAFGAKFAYDLGNRRQSTNVVDLTQNLEQPGFVGRMLGEQPSTHVMPRSWDETKALVDHTGQRVAQTRDWFWSGVMQPETKHTQAVTDFAKRVEATPRPTTAEQARSFATKYVPGAGRALNKVIPQAVPTTPANHPIASSVQDLVKKYQLPPTKTP